MEPFDVHVGHNASALLSRVAEQSMLAQADTGGSSFYTAVVFNPQMIDLIVTQDIRSVVDLVLAEKGFTNMVVWNQTRLRMNPFWDLAEADAEKVLPGTPWWHLQVHLNLEATDDPDFPLFLHAMWYFDQKGFNFFKVHIATDAQEDPRSPGTTWLRKVPLVKQFLEYTDKKEQELLNLMSSKARFPEECIGVHGILHYVTVDQVLDHYPSIGFVLRWTFEGKDLKPFPTGEVLSHMDRSIGASMGVWGSGGATILADMPTKGTGALMALDTINYIWDSPGEQWLNFLMKKSGAAPNAKIDRAKYMSLGGTTSEVVSGWIMEPSNEGLARNLFTEEEFESKVRGALGGKQAPAPASHKKPPPKVVVQPASACFA